MLTSISELYTRARGHARKRLVLAAANDEYAIEALVEAARQDIVKATLVGDRQKIEDIAAARGFDLGLFQMVNEPNNEQAAAISASMVRNGDADILMKGNLGTSTILKAVLNKETGLRTNELISHLALFEVSTYHKVFGLTDAAMNIAPDLSGKMSLIRNATGLLRKLGVDCPKVAMLSAVETVNPDMKSAVEAAILAKMSQRGQIRGCIVDGPFSLDNAISSMSAEIKGIDSLVAGDADLLVADDIEAANALYKSLVFLAGAKCAAVILGASAPIVLTSRADSKETKLNSIALAAAI